MLPWVISLARQVRRTILTNLAWAFGYNLVALTLAVLGLLQPVLAAAIMASSSVLLIVNSLRLTRLPDPILPPSPSWPGLTRQSIRQCFPPRQALQPLEPNTSAVNARYQSRASRRPLPDLGAFIDLLTKVWSALSLPACGR